MILIRSIEIEKIFELDFILHAIVFYFATIKVIGLFKSTKFIVKAIIILCFFNIAGIIFEYLQGFSLDGIFDIIANNVGIIFGLYIAKPRLIKTDTTDEEYLKSSLYRRFKINKVK